MNIHTNLDVVSIQSLLGMSYYIPSYQRGYRWTPQQVCDLLDDIDEFANNNEGYSKDGFYCIQPLVVKERMTEQQRKEFLSKLNNLGSSERFFETANELLNNIMQWEVIDGQQRLTTLCLILKYLSKNKAADYPYVIEYETRSSSDTTEEADASISTQNFLNALVEEKEEVADWKYATIDFYHFFEAYASIKEWFNGKSDEYKKKIEDTILRNVKVIWYHTNEADPIKVFTRLNIGKISLTNAELIKALFLNRSNFSDMDAESLYIKQNEIAAQWDNIEYSLQRDELWLFIHQKGYDRPTRIDFIFDIICEQDKLGIGNTNCGNDDYRTFRYFNNYFKAQRTAKTNGSDAIKNGWKEVFKIYNTIQEWYSDVQLYHYIGFLIECGRDIRDLLSIWVHSADKQTFIYSDSIMVSDKKRNGLVPSIKKIVKGCFDPAKGLDKTTYEDAEESVGKKTKCRPILLLHNLQTVIKQNEELKRHEDYPEGVFYKFPFHLLKNENWDIEHIDSNNENALDKVSDQKEWCAYALISDINLGENLELRIKRFLKTAAKEIKENEFYDIHSEVIKASEDTSLKDFLGMIDKGNLSEEQKSLYDKLYADVAASNQAKWDDPMTQKNMIWNYALLDSHTNRGYGNAIFPAKRRTIIGKDRGIRYEVNYDTAELHPTASEEKELATLMAKQTSNPDGLDENEKKRLNELKGYATVSFIPPCTRNVFMKYYSAKPNNLLIWGKDDAEAYLNNIKILLKDFLD